MLDRLGIALPIERGYPTAGLVEIACAAEEANLATVSVGETAGTDAMALLAAIAVSTSRIRLDASIVSPMVRTPPLMAMGAQTVAALAPDRFVLGIGAGSPMVASWHRRDFDSPLTAMRTTIDSLRALQRGEALEEWGNFRLRGLAALDDLPLYCAALNPRMLDLAGAKADGLILTFSGPEQVRSMSDHALSHRDNNRSDFAIVATCWAYAGDEIERARLALRNEMGVYLAVPTYRRLAVAMSSEDQVESAVAAWREGGRSAAAASFPDSIVSNIFVGGTGEALLRHARQLLDAGADMVRFVPVSLPTDGVRSSLRVIEALKEAATR